MLYSGDIIIMKFILTHKHKPWLHIVCDVVFDVMYDAVCDVVCVVCDGVSVVVDVE